MDLSLIILGVVCWALALVFLLILMRVAGGQDRAARHQQKKIDPFSDVTITKVGKPPDNGH